MKALNSSRKEVFTAFILNIIFIFYQKYSQYTVYDKMKYNIKPIVLSKSDIISNVTVVINIQLLSQNYFECRIFIFNLY